MLRSSAQQVIKNTAASTSIHSGRSCGKEWRPACMYKTFGGMPSLRRQKLGFPHIRLKRRFAPESWVRSASRPYLSLTRGAHAPTARQRPPKTQGRDPPSQLRREDWFAAAVPLSRRSCPYLPTALPMQFCFCANNHLCALALFVVQPPQQR
jgi:hypothetical protein